MLSAFQPPDTSRFLIRSDVRLRYPFECCLQFFWHFPHGYAKSQTISLFSALHYFQTLYFPLPKCWFSMPFISLEPHFNFYMFDVNFKSVLNPEFLASPLTEATFSSYFKSPFISNHSLLRFPCFCYMRPCLLSSCQAVQQFSKSISWLWSRSYSDDCSFIGILQDADSSVPLACGILSHPSVSRHPRMTADLTTSDSAACPDYCSWLAGLVSNPVDLTFPIY